ncbi:hypothetical protein D5086_018865 [Populus alba]|uniref:Uncharacterized protein n=1 Tax=Populus alba TaxID=43335 RepID=A0ACC4BQZ6_POPAL
MEDSKEIVIREVWSCNLESEFELIRELIVEFPYISMDTEFPGVVFRPPVDPTNNRNYFRQLKPSDHYKILKSNVDALNLIQMRDVFFVKDGPEQHAGVLYGLEWSYQSLITPDSINNIGCEARRPLKEFQKAIRSFQM